MVVRKYRTYALKGLISRLLLKEICALFEKVPQAIIRIQYLNQRKEV